MKCPLCGEDKDKKAVRVYHYWGPSSRNDGGSLFLYLAMRLLPGVESYRFECSGDPNLHGLRDLNVTVDWAADAWGKGDYVLPRPSVFWMSDTHMSPESKDWRYAKAKEFDHVYCAIIHDVQPLRKMGIEARWLPYAADPCCWKMWPMEKKYKIGFFGHYGAKDERVSFLNDILIPEFAPFDCSAGLFLELAAQRMSMYQIILNHCITDSTNQRVFEALAMGACLLTRETTDLELLGFRDREHLLTYRTSAEAKEKLREYLPRPDLCEAMGKKGREVVLQRHTYLHRALTILDMKEPDNMAELVLKHPGQTFGENELRMGAHIPVKLREGT